MIKANSKVNFNFGKINKLVQATYTSLEKTAEALHTEVVQAGVIPFDSGALQNDSTFVDSFELSKGVVALVSSTPYARRLYFHPEYHFQKKENENAKAEWYEDWLPGGKEENFAIKTFAKFYKREGEKI